MEYYIVNKNGMRRVGECVYDSYLNILKKDKVSYVVMRKKGIRILKDLEYDSKKGDVNNAKKL